MKEDIERNIVSFLNSDRVIDLNTPNYIRNNLECIRASIDRDIDSVRYIPLFDVNEELQAYAVNKALEKGYVLHLMSPIFLAKNYDIVKNSISLNVNSAHYALWESIAYGNSAEAMDELMDILVEKGYVLRGSDPDCFSTTYKLVKRSISLDVTSADYVDWAWLEKKHTKEEKDELIDILIEKGYVLHEGSPNFLKYNYVIAKNSINLDVYSADYVHWNSMSGIKDEKDVKELIDLLIQKGYILHRYSSYFLQRNYDVVKNSISLNVQSADCIDWETFKRNHSNKEYDKLMDVLVEKGYVLHGDSSFTFREIYKLVKNSISLDVNSADFVEWAWLELSSGKQKIEGLIDLLIEKKYIMHWNSSYYLRNKYKIAKSSINLDVKSADYVFWEKLNCSDEEMAELIDLAIEKGYILHRHSPHFLASNYKIIKNSIDKDIDNLNYVYWKKFDCSEEAMAELANLLIEKGYVLTKGSPVILKGTYKLVKNAINLDVNSADYVDWKWLEKKHTKEEKDELIDILLEKGYVLHEGSPGYLRKNLKVVFNSLKNDINSACYGDSQALAEPEIFSYALAHGYKFSWSFMADVPIDRYQNKNVIRKCYDYAGGYRSSDELYRDRIDSLFSSVIGSCPTIDIYKSVFQAVAVDKWNNYKRENANQLMNLFGKISSELRNSNDFEKSMEKLSFLGMMKKTLGDQYADFYQAMKEYYDIYHSDGEDKIEKMQASQDKISYYAALYCGKVKDNYIKERISECHTWLKNFFVLRLDNSTVDKKLVQPKRREKFKELYQEKNEEVIDFIESIIKKYSQELDKDTILKIIEGFILEDKAKIEDIIPKPDNYDAYERYERADKLIKRLNQGNISFSGPEVKNYQDIIGFDKEKGLYVYTGVSFSDLEKDDIDVYKKTNKDLEMIKKDIILKIKEMNLEFEISEEEMKKVVEEFPFTDEYFEFDKKYLSKIIFGQLCWGAAPYKWEVESVKNNEVYKLIYSVLIDQGLMWLLTLLQHHNFSMLSCNGICAESINALVGNALNLFEMSKELNIDLNSFDHIKFLNNISAGADLSSIDILGLDIVEKLCTELGFTSGNREKIVSRAKRLVAKMAGKSMSTVPYVSGETMNYKYSLYDSQDVEVLLAGINTDACFRVCGNDNDFLHYCCLDKNGFVIKITDKEGNFIARAGGFRNGNCVFLNQLRTIYDKRNDNYQGLYKNETMEIIETLRKACEDIVRTSQENELEKDKIDHVFVTRSYSLRMINKVVYYDVKNKIGDYPMETSSQDWEDFIDDNYSVLYISKSSKGFTTDYNNFRIICMASIKEMEELESKDLRFGDVDALYERTRNKIIATTNIDDSIIRKIRKIKGIAAYLEGNECEKISIPEGSTVFVGDNWYCVYVNGEVVDSCVLDCDEKAKREYELVHASFEKLTNEVIQQQLEDAQLLLNLQNSEANDYKLNKILKGSQC